MILSIHTSVVCSILFALSHLVPFGHTEIVQGTLYQKFQGVLVDESQEFSLGTRASGRTSCVVACAAHDQCQSVNFRSGGSSSVCRGTRNSYYGFGSKLSANSGSENFSPWTTEVKDGDWTLVFRAQRSVDKSFSDRLLWHAWNNDSIRSDENLNTLPRECYSPEATNCSTFFRSRWMANWPAQENLQVRLALYTGGVQKAEMIFNGTGSTTETWYNTARLIRSTWTDMVPGDTQNYISIPGQMSNHRLFVASTVADGNNCNQVAWVIVLGQPLNRCRFDKDTTVTSQGLQSPQFLYSSKTTKVDFSQAGSYALAEVMAIFIKKN